MGGEDGQQISCPICARKGMDSPLRQEPGRAICDACFSEFSVEHDDPTEVLLYDVEEELRDRHPVLFDHQMDVLPRRLAKLNHDAWFMIATGRYNGGIILLGTLIEATLQEVLYVYRYEFFYGPLGRLIPYIEAKGLVDAQLLRFARQFKDHVRNIWQHQKVHEITAGASLPAAKLSFDLEEDPEGSLERLEKAAEGEVEMEWVSAEEEPAMRGPLKEMIDAGVAVPLYNKVWMWLLFVASRYLRTEHFDQLHESYEGDGPETVTWTDGERQEVEHEPEPGGYKRVLAAPIYDDLTGRLR